jgi:hypothetical protein
MTTSQSAEGADGLMGDGRMPLSSQDDADRLDGVNGVGASEKQLSIEAQLRATANRLRRRLVPHECNLLELRRSYAQLRTAVCDTTRSHHVV